MATPQKGRAARRSKRPYTTAKRRLPALGAATAAATTATAAAATATTAATTTTTTAAAAIATALTGTSDVDVERAAIENGAVHAVDGALSLVARPVFNEAEASRLAAVTIGDDARGNDVSVRRKRVQKVLVAGGIGKIAYVEFVHCCLPDMLLRLKTLGRTLGAMPSPDVLPTSGSHSSRFKLARRNRRYTLTAGLDESITFF